MNFSRLITNWYELNKRNLPWRITKNPYFIWISEIILQQTRVNQGISYYHKFTFNYPTIGDLAAASEQRVLSDWQGLGYYQRARNLHETAKKITTEFDGKFPEKFELIKSLKGIGDYTASAIASFAFDQPHAVVDGNVYRVLSRIFDINLSINTLEGIAYFKELAQTLINTKNPAIHNQAIMEFGSLICTPKNPTCDLCPLIEMCLSRQNKTIFIRPVKTIKTKVKKRYFTYFHFEDANSIVIQKRLAQDIWKNLFEFPLIETDEPISFEGLSSQLQQMNLTHPIQISKTIKHILSHQHIYTQFCEYKTIPDKLKSIFPNTEIIKKKDLYRYPIPRLIDRYLSEK